MSKKRSNEAPFAFRKVPVWLPFDFRLPSVCLPFAFRLPSVCLPTGSRLASVCFSGVIKYTKNKRCTPIRAHRLQIIFKTGRKEATRTPDPYVPNVVRYQLRYFPISRCKIRAFFPNFQNLFEKSEFWASQRRFLL